MFIGIFTHTNWKSTKEHAKRPCVYRHCGDGFVEVFPCSSSKQFKNDYITVPLRGDAAFNRETHIIMDSDERLRIPDVWVSKLGKCPSDITQSIYDWETEHTVWHLSEEWHLINESLVWGMTPSTTKTTITTGL
jgi:hypothetical protein